MKVNHEEYLKGMLDSKKAELDLINMKHRITIAEYNTKKELITKQIYSIEEQLEQSNE